MTDNWWSHSITEIFDYVKFFTIIFFLCKVSTIFFLIITYWWDFKFLASVRMKWTELLVKITKSIQGRYLIYLNIIMISKIICHFQVVEQIKFQFPTERISNPYSIRMNFSLWFFVIFKLFWKFRCFNSISTKFPVIILTNK